MSRIRYSGLAIVVLLASCSGGLSASERDGLTVVINNDTSGGMDALLGGTLVVGPGHCMSADTGSGIQLVAWPRGTRVLEGGTGVDAPGIGTVLLGEDFTGGGGEAGSASLEIPKPCTAGDGPVMLLNGRQ